MHRISDVLRAAATLVRKHYICYYRFLSAGRWCLDELGITLLCVVLRLLKVRQVERVLDDTLSRRRGKKVALATMHADPLLRRAGRPFHSYGHVFVVLAVHILAPRLAKTGWALPFMFRLFEGARQGGRADAPSDKKRGAQRRRRGVEQRNRQRLTDRKVVGDKVIACCPRRDTGPLPDGIRPTKLTLASQMVLKVARQLPHIHFCVLADHLYHGRTLLHEVHSQVQNVTFVVRGHPDAALYELPPPRQPGQRGRPRTRGDRLPNPQTWAAQHRQAFSNVAVPMYGDRVAVKVASFVGMSYRTLPSRLVRYVIVKDPKGIYRTQYLMSTDTELSPQQVVAAYARRWPPQRTFQHAKHKLGMQDAQTQLPASVRRTAPMALLTYSLVVLGYVANGHDEVQRLRRHRDPWYDKHARPSFTDMLAALRRLGWRRGFLDPAQGATRRSKMLEVYLDSVAAAA